MSSATASNFQNANKQNQSNMEPVISLQSGGSVKCAATSERLTQTIRGWRRSPHDESVTEQMAQREEDPGPGPRLIDAVRHSPAEGPKTRLTRGFQSKQQINVFPQKHR